eukprot:SAG22_NODE_638_length_8262_cov_4.658826_5_plen_191_part_00
MDASPNYVRRVNTCDGAPSCAAGAPATENSRLLQELFVRGFAEMGLPSGLSPMTGGSDFYPFVLAGIPATGLATGAGGVKTEAERDEHGGFALAQLDPCYHAPCDSTANIALDCLKETAELATRVITTLADVLPFAADTRRPPLDATGVQRLTARLHSREARPAVESCSGADEEAAPVAGHAPHGSHTEV